MTELVTGVRKIVVRSNSYLLLLEFKRKEAVLAQSNLVTVILFSAGIVEDLVVNISRSLKELVFVVKLVLVVKSEGL